MYTEGTTYIEAVIYSNIEGYYIYKKISELKYRDGIRSRETR